MVFLRCSRTYPSWFSVVGPVVVSKKVLMLSFWVAVRLIMPAFL